MAAHNPAIGQDDGFYYVVATNLFYQATSTWASLTILPELNPPALLGAEGASVPGQITLSFSKNLWLDPTDPLTAPTNVANYTVTNLLGQSVSIISAQVLNGSNVVLTLAGARPPTSTWVVSVHGVWDTSAQHHGAMDLASPIRTWLPLVNLVDSYYFAQPLDGVDSLDDFTSGAWLRSDYDPDVPGRPWFFPGYSLFFFRGDISGYTVPLGSQLSFAGDSRASSTYFLKPFTFPGLPASARLRLRHLTAHGAVFYLNGAELFRTNLPAGLVTPGTLPTNVVTSLVPTAFLEMPASNLGVGRNLLAVELHTGLGSLAPAFALELQATIEIFAAESLLLLSPPANQAVYENDPATFQVNAAGAFGFQWKSNGVAIANATNNTYTIPHVPISANGTGYSVVVAGATTTLESPPAVLSIVPDSQPVALGSAFLTATNALTVSFNKPVTPISATNLGNYLLTNIAGGTVPWLGATRLNDRSVLFKIPPLAPGSYQVLAQAVQDTTASGHLIRSNSCVTLGARLPLLDFTSRWRYDDYGFTGPPYGFTNDWTAPAYNDQGSGWNASSPGLFDALVNASGVYLSRGSVAGYPVGTVLHIANATNAHFVVPTYYFRTHVNVPFVTPDTTLTLNHLVDAGAAFYVNGQWFHALGLDMPTSYTNYATRTWVSEPTVTGPFSVPAANLAAGDNVLAAEVHISSAAAISATFGAQIMLNVPSTILTVTNASAPSP